MSKITIGVRSWTFDELRDWNKMLRRNGSEPRTEWDIIQGLLDYIAANPAPAALRDAFTDGYYLATKGKGGMGEANDEAAALYPDFPTAGPMTRDQFEAMYAAKSNTTVWELHRMGRFAYPCACDDADCKGWQMAHVQIQNENDAPAPYKAGCSSAVPCRNCPGCANCAPENF